MSAAAEAYYKQRAADFAIAEIPPILGSEPLQLMPNTSDSPIVTGMGRARGALETVESFVSAGVPQIYASRNEQLEQPDWQILQGLIPTRSYDTATNYIRKRLRPLALEMRKNKYTTLMLEAVSRDETPLPALKRAFRSGSSPQRIAPEYEVSQVYVLARAYSQDGIARDGLLTVVEGVANPYMLKKQFISARYCGARLLSKEVATD